MYIASASVCVIDEKVAVTGKEGVRSPLPLLSFFLFNLWNLITEIIQTWVCSVHLYTYSLTVHSVVSERVHIDVSEEAYNLFYLFYHLSTIVSLCFFFFLFVLSSTKCGSNGRVGLNL